MKKVIVLAVLVAIAVAVYLFWPRRGAAPAEQATPDAALEAGRVSFIAARSASSAE